MVEEFIRATGIDERAARALRECSADIQCSVIKRGGLSRARNRSSVILARIQEAEAGVCRNEAGGSGCSPATNTSSSAASVSAGDSSRSSAGSPLSFAVAVGSPVGFQRVPVTHGDLRASWLQVGAAQGSPVGLQHVLVTHGDLRASCLQVGAAQEVGAHSRFPNPIGGSGRPGPVGRRPDPLRDSMRGGPTSIKKPAVAAVTVVREVKPWEQDNLPLKCQATILNGSTKINGEAPAQVPGSRGSLQKLLECSRRLFAEAFGFRPEVSEALDALAREAGVANSSGRCVFSRAMVEALRVQCGVEFAPDLAELSDLKISDLRGVSEDEKASLMVLCRHIRSCGRSLVELPSLRLPVRNTFIHFDVEHNDPSEDLRHSAPAQLLGSEFQLRGKEPCQPSEI